MSSLFRYFKTGQFFKTSQVKTHRISIGGSVKQFDDPNKAIEELEALQERIKQSDKSGQQIFMIRQGTGDKSTEVKINNPEEELKVLSDLKEKIRQAQESGNSASFTLTNNARQIINEAPISAFPMGARSRIRITSMLSPLQCAVVAIFCGAMGALVLFVANDERQTALASINWPTVEGRITNSYNEFRGRRFDRVGKVLYSYTVNGEQYSNKNIAFNSTLAQDHYDAPKRYPINSTIKVFYSPEHPSRSCLELGNTNILGQGFYGATICLAVGLFFLFLCLTAGQKQRENSYKSVID